MIQKIKYKKSIFKQTKKKQNKKTNKRPKRLVPFCSTKMYLKMICNKS